MISKTSSGSSLLGLFFFLAHDLLFKHASCKAGEPSG